MIHIGCGYSFHHKDITILVKKDIKVKYLQSTGRMKTDWQPLPKIFDYILFSFSHSSLNSSGKFDMFSITMVEGSILGDNKLFISGDCYIYACHSVFARIL